MRVAILDDYQQVSLASADWSAVRSLGQIDVFAEHIGRTEALVSALKPYDVVVAMRERTPFDADTLGQLPRLRLLVTTGMGNASIDLEAAAARGITVSGTGGIGTSTAELTWGLILALLRHIPEEDQRLKQAGRAGGAALGFGGSWQRTVGTGLDGKRLGVVGLGHQGRRVADIGRAFGMKVVAWSQNLDPDVAKKAHVKAVSKEELFSSSDVVTVHYKLSPRSVGLVGAAELALMKPSAYLVNTSRGSAGGQLGPAGSLAVGSDRGGGAGRVRRRAAAAVGPAAVRAQRGADPAPRLRHRGDLPGLLRRRGRGHRRVRSGFAGAGADRVVMTLASSSGRGRTG